MSWKAGGLRLARTMLKWLRVMKKLVNRIGPFDKKKHCLNVVVETPKGSRVKYSYDPENGVFILSKALPCGMSFPFNFGFIPGTQGDDGDPLDILILNEEPLITGCLLHVRPIAVIKASQSEGKAKIRNDRIIGEAIGKETPSEMQALELNRNTTTQIEFFFVSYNKLYGKEFKVLGIGNEKTALKLVRAAEKVYHAGKNK